MRAVLRVVENEARSLGGKAMYRGGIGQYDIMRVATLFYVMPAVPHQFLSIVYNIS
jgi:hypothetical protein